MINRKIFYMKEYDDYGSLIYEGEYLNGVRNGKGKIYRNGKIEYEGEFLNGEMIGKGKEYDQDGKLISEGENICSYKFNGKKKFFI